MLSALPDIRSEVPGPRSRELARRLSAVECPGVSCFSGPLPFWERGAGATLFDVDGNRFVDLLAGFGTACLGHAPRELAEVAAQQAGVLLQAHGDLYPARLKVELLEALARLLPGDLGWAILSASGSDAVESALKTALRATGRAGVIAFEGAYHGLGLGALDATHRDEFRAPFRERLPGRTRFLPWGDLSAVRDALRKGDAGAILIEPVQGRGGVRVVPPGFLGGLRALADEHDVLLVADEVYTGLGRCGDWLACQADGVLPDVVALGKGLGGGFPISACVGRTEVMARWGVSQGEALHTSTHLGNPLGCALALRVLECLEDAALPQRAATLGDALRERLRVELATAPDVIEVRGRGLMIGIELRSGELAARIVAEALALGWLLVAEGPEANVLSLTPPLTIASEQLDGAADLLVGLLSG